jgi:hypothetical protein
MSIGSLPALGISWLVPQLPHEIIVVVSFGCSLTETIPQFGHVKTLGNVFLTTWTTLLFRRPMDYSDSMSIFKSINPLLHLLCRNIRIKTVFANDILFALSKYCRKFKYSGYRFVIRFCMMLLYVLREEIARGFAR